MQLRSTTVVYAAAAAPTRRVHPTRRLPPPQQAIVNPISSSSKAMATSEAARKGAILGSIVADAATMGIHWIYKTDQLDALLASKGKQATPEFFEPPSCPFYQVWSSVSVGDGTSSSSSSGSSVMPPNSYSIPSVRKPTNQPPTKPNTH